MSHQDHCLPAHLAPLVPSEWALWSWFVLRGAGLPAQLLTPLSSHPCALAADALAACESALQSLFEQAARALDRQMADLRQKGLDRRDAGFKATLKARRLAAAGKLSPLDAQKAGLNELALKLDGALGERRKCHEEFEKTFAQSIDRQSHELWKAARNPLFQEAVLWQNRHAFETAVLPLASRPEAASGRKQLQREREQLIAGYLQRYCVKNDTIGFFGPVAWGQMSAEGPALEAAPGASLVRERHTYFEDWAIDQLAVGLSSIPGMDWWSPPRLAPHFHVEGAELHAPGAAPIPLEPLAQAVLPLCNGENLPADILPVIRGDERFANIGREELLAFLSAMAGQNVLLWRLLVPVEANAELNLHRQLMRVQDSELRQIALEKFDRLEAARRKVSEAAGDPARLHSALGRLDRTFEEITNAPGTRNAGATYGGRTVIYEDCRRDLSLSASPELLRPLLPSLSLLLRSLRWLMQSASLTFLRIFREVYRELSARSGSKDISALVWWMVTEERLNQDASVYDAEQTFLKKWEEIMPLSSGARRVQWQSHTLRERVEQAFPDLPGHYHPVRYYCPDLLIAGADAGSIGRGEAMYVLGEIHSGKNTLIHTALAGQHPNLQELVRGSEWDISSGCFKIAESRAEGKSTTRTSERVLRPADYFLSTTMDAMAPSGFASHPFSELLITETGGRLMAATRNGARSFEILEAFSDLLFSFVVHKAAWVPRARYVPRVLIDQLVIQREAWRIPAGELEFAAGKNESRRFLGVREWAGKQGVPETLFVKVPLEVKPFYVDLTSPVYVEILCKAIRRLQASSSAEKEVTFSEMLPRMQDAWLPGPSGARYTSEFRFAIVDLKAREFSEEYKKQSEPAVAMN